VRPRSFGNKGKGFEIRSYIFENIGLADGAHEQSLGNTIGFKIAEQFAELAKIKPFKPVGQLGKLGVGFAVESCPDNFITVCTCLLGEKQRKLTASGNQADVGRTTIVFGVVHGN